MKETNMTSENGPGVEACVCVCVVSILMAHEVEIETKVALSTVDVAEVIQ